ncbi:hypothetical protein [Eubacterium sp. AB3007]|uniref:hypothetical protein n=1 Tax=Eubacterium sp. AB3007 TaxID=1392487 RepID=UPI0004840230|nr:hypothetical protein [Eubacterium sp. AB3007]
MFTDRVDVDIVNNILRQKGATRIKTFHAYVNIVTFVLGKDFEVQYVYNMKEEENNYLERVSPVPYYIGEPVDGDALVEMIMEDLRSYQEAFESNNFPIYLDISKKVYQARREIESLFLDEDYAKYDMLKDVNDLLDQLLDKLEDTAEEMIPDEGVDPTVIE